MLNPKIIASFNTLNIIKKYFPKRGDLPSQKLQVSSVGFLVWWWYRTWNLLNIQSRSRPISYTKNWNQRKFGFDCVFHIKMAQWTKKSHVSCCKVDKIQTKCLNFRLHQHHPVCRFVWAGLVQAWGPTLRPHFPIIPAYQTKSVM